MRVTLAVLALAIAAPALAARDLPVPLDKGWQHAATRLILPATLDGLARTKLIDQTAAEYDVAAEFTDGKTVATIYIFRPAVDDVALWFERSEAQIFDRARYGEVAPNSADPVAFAPPRSTSASGLRRIYSTGARGFRSTGLAIMPLGDWLVAIRISDPTKAPDALDAKLSAVIAAMRWPEHVASAPTPSPIAACAVALRFDRAKLTKPQTSDILLALVAGGAATEAKTPARAAPPVRWCRDPASTQQYGVYRNVEQKKGYMLAIGDAGRVLHVSPTLEAQMGKGDGFSVAFVNLDGVTTSYPGFDGLPAPQQAMDSLRNPAVATANGTSITIDAKSLSGK